MNRRQFELEKVRRAALREAALQLLAQARNQADRERVIQSAGFWLSCAAQSSDPQRNFRLRDEAVPSYFGA